MLKVFCFAIATFLSIAGVQSQIIIKGIIKNLPSSVTQMAIDKWSVDSWTELDRIDIATDKSFYKKVNAKFGQHRLRLWGEPSHWIDFIIPQQSTVDAVLDFSIIDYPYFDGNPAKLEGKEHEVYFHLLTDHKIYRVLRDSLSKSGSLTIEAKAILEAEVEKAKFISNKRCKEVTVSNRGNFSGDIVANLLYVPDPGDYASSNINQPLSGLDFEREHLLDLLPLSDGRVMLHNGFIRALNQYTSKFLDADSSNYIKNVLAKRKGNEEVDNWLFKYLFQVSLNYKNDNALSYLVTWYNDKSLHGPIEVDRSTENLLVAFSNCEVGKQAYDLSLPDVNGKNIRLADIVAKSKLTLLVFWRTDCSHCKEFKEVLQELYIIYKPLGLEVIGISIDQVEANWKNYLAAYPASWTNLFPPTRDQRIQVIANFPIPATPAVIAVDKDFKVKNRMVIRATIDKYLEDELWE